MIPRVQINKTDGNVGTIPLSTDGIGVIIAAASAGGTDVVNAFARQSDMVAEYGSGPLVHAAAYVMQVTKRPVVCIRHKTTTAGTYSAMTKSGTGTFTPGAGASVPVDSLKVRVEFIVGGALGTAGIVYRYRLGNGKEFSAQLALGTATSFVIPNTGITVLLGSVTNTVVAGDAIDFFTTAPAPSSQDLLDAYEALRVYGGKWDLALPLTPMSSAQLTAFNSWIGALNAVGKWKFGFAGPRLRGEGVSGETRAAYLTAMQGLYSATEAFNVSFEYDGFDCVSPVNGIIQSRSFALAVFARALSVDIGIDPAWVELGSLQNCSITDDRQSPIYHDEELYPGADDLRFTAARSIASRPGVYINNARVFSNPTSDYQFVQHARVINAACETAYQALLPSLSRAILTDRTTGFILETEAKAIEAVVNGKLEAVLRNGAQPRCSSVEFILSRTDNILSTFTLKGQVKVQFNGYAKTFIIDVGATNPALRALAS